MEKSIRVGQETGKSSVGRSQLEDKELFTCGTSEFTLTLKKFSRYENVLSILIGNGVLCVLYILTSNTGLPRSVPMCVLDKASRKHWSA